MSRLGTDVLALACIAGGALVGGVATLAMVGDGHDHHHAVECAPVTDVATASAVVVSVDGLSRVETVVVSPEAHRHQAHCVGMGEFEWTEFDQQQLEVARIQMEVAREKLEAKRLELDGMDLRLEGVGFGIEGIHEEISQEIQAALDQEMERLTVELKRLEEIGR